MLKQIVKRSDPCTLLDGNAAANDDAVYELKPEVATRWFNTGRYCRIGTIGDGSCFFHSVCKALDVKNYRECSNAERKNLIKHFRAGLSSRYNEETHAKISGELVGQKKIVYETMKTDLAKTATWADEAMIRYTAMTLGCNIIFFNVGNNANKMYCGVHDANTMQAIANCGVPTACTIIVAWVDHSHFELVGRIDEIGPSEVQVRVVFDPMVPKDLETIENVMRAYQVKCKL